MSCPNAHSSTPTREQLLAVTNRYLTAFANNKTHPLSMLTFFSTTSVVSIQHYPSNSQHPQASILRGPNAVRSYFDLIATHWTRSPVSHKTITVDSYTRTVVFEGSVTWKWKKSGRSWVEDFTCTLAFDEVLKIVNYVVRTDSASQTCLMRAKDIDDSSFAKIIHTNTSPVQIVVRQSHAFFFVIVANRSNFHLTEVDGFFFRVQILAQRRNASVLGSASFTDLNELEANT